MQQCVILVQTPSPTVETPPDLNVQQLAEIGFEALGKSPADAQRLSTQFDWKTTLVVPVPSNIASYESVQVDGTTGYLIFETRTSGPAQYTIVWVKNGVIYDVSAYGDLKAAQDMAANLKLQ